MMSYCTRDGDDKAVFLTEEDYDKPGMLYTLTINEDEWGVILPTGEINWKCPCLGGIVDSPCGEDFKEAFSCFHYSEGEMKGIECIESFKKFQSCVETHPEVFGDMEPDEIGVSENSGDTEGITLDRSNISATEGKNELTQDNTSLIPK